MRDEAGRPPRRMAWLRRRRARVALALAALGLIGLVVDYWAYPYGADVGGVAANRGENGLWLRYTWYFGQHSDADVRALADRLRAHQIRHAYFHVRGITRDGALKYRHGPDARRLVAAMHQRAPGARAVAWVYAGNTRGEGQVDLSRPAVRQRMVGEALWLVRECGFDGVQWDYEICPSGDQGLLALLRETRAALPAGTLVSVAAPAWLPWPLGRWSWSQSYFASVSRLCDQVCVMCYDTGFVLPRAYVWLTAKQVVEVTRAARSANPACRVLVGVPTYGPGFRSHNPRAENLAMALRGVRHGLADPGTRREAFAGVALFADYTTDAAEWRTYDRWWLGNPSP